MTETTSTFVQIGLHSHNTYAHKRSHTSSGCKMRNRKCCKFMRTTLGLEVTYENECICPQCICVFAPIDYFIHLNINILNKFLRFFLCFFHYFRLPFTLPHTYTPILHIQCLNRNAQKFPHLPTDRNRCNKSGCFSIFFCPISLFPFDFFGFSFAFV